MDVENNNCNSNCSSNSCVFEPKSAAAESCQKLSHFLGADLISNSLGASGKKRAASFPAVATPSPTQSFAEPLLVSVTGTPLINWRYNRQHFNAAPQMSNQTAGGRQKRNSLTSQQPLQDDVFLPSSLEYSFLPPQISPYLSTSGANHGQFQGYIHQHAAPQGSRQKYAPIYPRLVTAFATKPSFHHPEAAVMNASRQQQHDHAMKMSTRDNLPQQGRSFSTADCMSGDTRSKWSSSQQQQGKKVLERSQSEKENMSEESEPRVARFNYALFLASRKLQSSSPSLSNGSCSTKPPATAIPYCACCGAVDNSALRRNQFCRFGGASLDSSSSCEELAAAECSQTTTKQNSMDSGLAWTSDDTKHTSAALNGRRRRRRSRALCDIPPRFQHPRTSHRCMIEVCPSHHHLQGNSKPTIIFVPNVSSSVTGSCYGSSLVCHCSQCLHNAAAVQHFTRQQPVPPSYCYLSIIRDSSASNNSTPPDDDSSSIEDGRALSGSPQFTAPNRWSKSHGNHIPVITIAVPPNCRIVRDDESVRLSTSFSSSSESLFPADEPHTSDEPADDTSSLISDPDCDEQHINNPSYAATYSRFKQQQQQQRFFLRRQSLVQTVNVSPPPARPWITLQPESKHCPTFTVLCYNVLCDKYASPNLYGYCPSWALSWDYRRKYIMEEVKSSDADIVTLQEVETEQYNTLFQPELSALGYEGIFSPKSRAKTMMDEEKKKVDGCAIFWKTKKFTFEKENLVEFTRIAIAKADGSDNMLNRVMTRDNIALAAVLTVKDAIYSQDSPAPTGAELVTGYPLVVCTAHIHWDPEFCDVKELNTILEQAAESWSKSANIEVSLNDVPFLLCGDLNSLPESGVYEYLTSGSITTTHKDLKEFRGDPCLEKLNSTNGAKDCYTHSLRMDSAYGKDMLPFTNYTFDFKGVIDYVFAPSHCLSRQGLLGAFDTNWFVDNKILGCPHPHVPSDHLPLLVQYAILPRGMRPPAAHRPESDSA